MDDYLCVGVGVKLMARPFEFGAKLEEIVNLSVKNHPNCLVLIVDRLLASRYVNNAQPSNAQSHAALHVDTFLVGSAVENALAHTMNRGSIDSAVALRVSDTCDSAHTLKIPLRNKSTLKYL
jgi:hypothetical protein